MADIFGFTLQGDQILLRTEKMLDLDRQLLEKSLPRDLKNIFE